MIPVEVNTVEDESKTHYFTKDGMFIGSLDSREPEEKQAPKRTSPKSSITRSPTLEAVRIEQTKENENITKEAKLSKAVTRSSE